MLFPSVAITIYERERVEQARANNTGDGIDGGKVWSVGKTGGGVVARFSQLHGMALVQVSRTSASTWSGGEEF